MQVVQDENRQQLKSALSDLETEAWILQFGILRDFGLVQEESGTW